MRAVVADIGGELNARRRVAADQVIAELATRQHGIVSRAQLLRAGVSQKQITTRLQAWRLLPLYRGVYAVGHACVGRQGRWMASVLVGGPGAVLSHRSAGALWGIAPYAGSWIDVSVPRHGRRRRGRIVVHGSRLVADDVTAREGIPVTTLARTLLDLAEIVELRRLERALERAEKLELLDRRAIQSVIARSRGRHGLKNLRQALALYSPDDRSRSEFEREFPEFCVERCLPIPEINAIVEADRTYEVDVLWRDARLIVELDSWEHHRTRRAFEDDRLRDTQLRLAGYEVIRITWRRLADDPAAVAATIRRLLENVPR